MTIAMLLIAALGPGSARAAKLTGESFPTTLSATSTSEPVFTMEEGLSVKCKKASYSGTLSEASSSFSLAPTFSECTAFGFAATVATAGCQFVFHPGTETESKNFAATTDISCEAGKSIAIAATTISCEVQISTQSGLETTQTANNGSSPNGVTIELALKKETYNKTKDGFGCPLNGTGIKEDGGLTGNSTLTGKVAGLASAVGLVDWTYFCKDNLGNECDAKQIIKPPASFTGTATDFKIVTQYFDGTNTNNVTVTCKKATLSGATVDYVSRFSLSHKGQQEASLETFNTETCTEDKGNACTAVEVRKVPSLGWFAFGVNGNGSWEVELKLKVSCSTAVVTFTCNYAKTMSFNFEGDVTAAKVKAPGVNLDFEKLTGEKNCGKNPANLTATYTLSLGGFLRKG